MCAPACVSLDTRFCYFVWQGSSEEQLWSITDGQNYVTWHVTRDRQLGPGPGTICPPQLLRVCSHYLLFVQVHVWVNSRCLLIQQWKPNKSDSESLTWHSSPAPGLVPGSVSTSKYRLLEVWNAVVTELNCDSCLCKVGLSMANTYSI